MTLKFSGVNEPNDASGSALRVMANEAIEKTKEKSAIIKKLEIVRGLANTIETIGDSVKEVSYTLHTYRCLSVSHDSLCLASSCGQGSLDGCGRTHQGLVINCSITILRLTASCEGL